ncbi:MAG: hypothetical protein Q7T82_10270 [Armatimonadota bacterium]|nr:hypothetical protein [Armatimonadota bacterium]
MDAFLQRYSLQIIVWLGALSTLAIFSILYKENAFYRLFEHIFIGLATGQGIFMTVSQVLHPLWWKRMTAEGQWYWVFAFLAGMMFYFVYSRKYAWISRIIFGAFMGFTAGLTFKAFATQYVPQIAASFKPLGGPPSSARPDVTAMTVVYAVSFLVFLLPLVWAAVLGSKAARLKREAGIR